MTTYETLTETQRNRYDWVKETYEKNGKKRRDGSPYFNHCWNVWLNFTMIYQETLDGLKTECPTLVDSIFFLCLAHDMVEDKIVDKDELMTKFGEFVDQSIYHRFFEEGIDTITHKDDEEYIDYINRIKVSKAKEGHIIFITLKLSDIMDNATDPGCTTKQRAKYREAIDFLHS